MNGSYASSVGSVRNPYDELLTRQQEEQQFLLSASLATSADMSAEDEGEPVTFGYIIAKPEIRNSNSNRRVCFVYTFINDTFRKGGGEDWIVWGDE